MDVVFIILSPRNLACAVMSFRLLPAFHQIHPFLATLNYSGKVARETCITISIESLTLIHIDKTH